MSTEKNKRNYKTKKHNSYASTRKNVEYTKYVILFDLDETLGYFQDLGFTFDNEARKNPDKSKKEIMFSLLDKNPDSFRINLFSLLSYIKSKKQRNKNIKVALFSNNQGPKYWYTSIVEYINSKMKYELFDAVIGPYKIGSSHIEKQRTTHNKSILDISKILNAPLQSSKFIMFDDQYHTNMNHSNVKYIHLYPYVPKYVDQTRHNDNTYIREHIMMKQQLKNFLSKSESKTRKTRRKNKRSRKRNVSNDKLVL